MQDLHAISGGTSGRFFGVHDGGRGAGKAGAGIGGGGVAAAAMDRRFQPYPQHNLRCPRCDSLNTKFCYYNNYNLSQPRHFCKSCRRYWTKGGVLRNVPIGGGCRKSKRSSTSSKTSKSASNVCKDNRSSSSAVPVATSSSDSSTPSANAYEVSTITKDTATPPPPAPAFDSYAPTFLDSINGNGPTTAPETPPGNFPENGSFSCSLIAASSNADMMDLHFASHPELHQLLPLQQPKATQPQPRAGLLDAEIGIPGAGKYVDQMPHILDALPPPAQGRSAAGPQLTTFDWAGSLEAATGLFDAAGYHGGYWHHSQWDFDPSFFLP